MNIAILIFAILKDERREKQCDVLTGQQFLQLTIAKETEIKKFKSGNTWFLLRCHYHAP
jgi:hypothetical protein